MEKFGVIFILVGFLLVPIPILAQEMGFYENSKYNFSFEAPTNWRYLEEVSFDGETVNQILMYPEEFSLNTNKNNTGLMDLSAAEMAGLDFQVESPLIGIIFENISESVVPTLGENELTEFINDRLEVESLSAEIINTSTKSHDWGWEVSTAYNFDLDTGFGSPWPYVGYDTTYFFKDREAYTVFFLSHEIYHDRYLPDYEHILETMIIKGVVIPEFHEIALFVLVISIIMIIVITRKMNFIIPIKAIKVN